MCSALGSVAQLGFQLMEGSWMDRVHKMHFQLNECVGLVWPCSIYAVHMAQTEQQEENHRSLNATTCNFVLLMEYLWKMEKFPKTITHITRGSAFLYFFAGSYA